MALNQTPQTPLTLFSGSLSAHTVAAGSSQGQLMALISSSIPAYDAAFWEYKIKTETTYITSATQTQITELATPITDNTKYYLILGYFSIGCSSTTNPPRLGNVFSSIADSVVNTELTNTLTTTLANWEGTTGPPITTWPSSNVNNFYLGRVIFVGKPTSTSGIYTPSLAVSASAVGVTASMGPSIVMIRKF